MSESSITIENLKAALSGELHAMAKYSFFAKRCRELGDHETAKLFETVAKEEISHALGHMDSLYMGKHLTVKEMLQMAHDGEVAESCPDGMYPTFAKQATTEAERLWAQEHAQESAEHAQLFGKQLEVARKRFNALTSVEQRHANRYAKQIESVEARQ